MSTVLAGAFALLATGVASAQNNVVSWGGGSLHFPPPSIEKTIKISSRVLHTLALQESGAMFAWGDNRLGECNVPTGLPPCTQIAAGLLHNAALSTNGTVFCWGYNGDGECDVPPTLGACKAVAAGEYHTVAIKLDGTVVSWGADLGQLESPPDLGPCKAISANLWNTGAIKENGTVVVWGDNTDGLCDVPPTLGPCKALALGSSHVIALKDNGTVACWGQNSAGQCNVPGTLGTCTAIAAGEYHSVALKSNGTVVCWGSNTKGQCTVPGTLGTCLAISAGEGHTMALKTDGTLKGWGDNFYGQCTVPEDIGPCTLIASGTDHRLSLQSDGTVIALGSNDQGQTSVPTNLGTCTKIAAGTEHSVALKTNGTVRAWGNNVQGQCNVPGTLGTCQAIGAGWQHTLAVKTNGTVVCWGRNLEGQSTVPGTLGSCKSVAGGFAHSVGLKQNGTVVCWGDNTYGQCNVPPSLGTCIAVAAALFHTVALKTDGTVVAWGQNYDGRCGSAAEQTGTGLTAYWTKSGLGACTQIAAGNNHSMALRSDGSVAVWGDNSIGQCNAPAGVYTAIDAGDSCSYAVFSQGATPCATSSVAQTANVLVNASYWRFALAWTWPDGGVRVPGSLSNVDLGDYGSIASDCAAEAGTFISRSTSKLYVPITCPSGSCPGLGAPAVTVSGQAKLGGTMELKITGTFPGTTLPADLPSISVLKAVSIDPARNTFDVLITDPPPPAGMFATLVPEAVSGGTLYSLKLFAITENANLTGSTGTSANGAAIAVDSIDFTGDGFDDIALAVDLGGSGLLQVLLNDGLGNLGGTSVLKSLPASPTSIAVGDFDGDSLRNEVAVGFVDGTIRIYHSNGSSFVDGTVITNPGVSVTSVCELPGSSGASEVAAGLSNETITIRNAISGSVTHTIPVAGTPGVIKAGNLDGVKGKDMATGGNAASSFNRLTGEAGFVQVILATDTDYNAIAPMPVFGTPVALQMADIDNDGLAEIVTANADPVVGAPGSPLPVFGLFRNVAGTFSGIVPVAPAGSSAGLDVALVDVNNDGIRDLVTVYKTVGASSEAALVNINTFGPGFPLTIGATTIINNDNPTLVTRANLDGNASDDVFLVTQGSPFALSGDSVIEPYLGSLSPGLFGDLDGDGFVDGADVGLLLLDFGPCPGCASDLDGDGVVDGADMGLLLLNFS